MPGSPGPHLKGAWRGGQASPESWGSCPFGRNGTPLARTKGVQLENCGLPSPSQQGRNTFLFSERVLGRKPQLWVQAAESTAA